MDKDKDKKIVNIGLKIPADLHKRVKAKAKRMIKPVSVIIRDLLEQFAR